MSRGSVAALVAVGFVAGTAVGALTVAALSARASRLYLKMVRMSFASEEEARLAGALQRGEVARAFAHAACGLEAEMGSKAFDPDAASWGLGFPLMGAFVTSHTKYPVDDSTRLRALAHAKLGLAWEEIGHRDQADLEYEEAGRLTGVKDAEKWRRTAKQLLDQIGRKVAP